MYIYTHIYILYIFHIYVLLCILYYYIYYILVRIYICLFVYFYIRQSFKEVNLARIKKCLTLVVKVKSLKSITSRQCLKPLKLYNYKVIQVILIVL